MENNQPQTNMEGGSKKISLKTKAYLALAVVALVASGYGYWWIQKTNDLRKEAEGIAQQAQKYETLKSAVKSERARCENFIAQKEGDFGSFEYCKRFIDWTDNVSDI